MDPRFSIRNLRYGPQTRLVRGMYSGRRNLKISSGLNLVHTYPDIFESATFSFRIRLPPTPIRRIVQSAANPVIF